MRAVIAPADGAGRVEVADRDDPEPGSGEILIRVRAAGINNADLLQVAGMYPAPPGAPPDIPGLELAGEVLARGPGADRIAMPVPDHMSWPEAGGFPEAFTTAHDALFTQAGLGPGERVCVHGAAGGVGTAGVQLAAAVGGRVVATVRDPSRHPEVERLADGVRAVDPAGFEDLGPFDVVLELIGAPNMAADLRSLAAGGRIVVIGMGGGAVAEINLHLLMLARGRIHASTLRPRPLEQKADAARRVEAHVLPLFVDGRVRVPVLATYPLHRAADAYARFATGGKLGKIVLLIDAPGSAPP